MPNIPIIKFVALRSTRFGAIAHARLSGSVQHRFGVLTKPLRCAPGVTIRLMPRPISVYVPDRGEVMDDDDGGAGRPKQSHVGVEFYENSSYSADSLDLGYSIISQYVHLLRNAPDRRFA